MAERICRGLVKYAVLLEVGKCIGVEHLGPLVAVVPGGVSAGKDVAELGRHALGVVGEHLHPRDGLGLKGGGIVDRRLGSVPRHVEVAKHELAQAGVCGAVALGGHEAVYLLLRDGLAGEVVAGKGVEKLALGEVIFVELRGQLHKVAVYRCAGQRLVIGPREQAVQGVAKLMQEGLHLVGREQRGGVGGGLGEIHHDGHHRALVAAVGADALGAEFGHPCARALRCAGEEVGVYHAHKSPVGIGHVVCLHVGVVHLGLGIGCELQPVEASGQAEHAFYHIVQLEIRAQRLLVK